MNIIVSLEQRQWLPVEEWASEVLEKFCEDAAIHHITCSDKMELNPVVTDRRSTMDVVFSCNGKYFASGHLTHDIVVGHMTPCIRYWKTLSGHDRTPWVLTFDLVHPHFLYSGSLDGKVCKWNIQEEGSYSCSFRLPLSSPVNSITTVPTHPNLLLVAVRCYISLLSTADLSQVWRTETLSFDHIVRLVQHHPLESKLLIATNTPRAEVESHSSNTTYTLRLYLFHKDHPPNLTHTTQAKGNSHAMSSHGQMVCSGVKVLSTHSCVMTGDLVLCVTQQTRQELTVYSIAEHSCGERLYSVYLERNLMSMDLSPYSGYLLVGFIKHRHAFHYESPVGTHTEVYRFIHPKNYRGKDRKFKFEWFVAIPAWVDMFNHSMDFIKPLVL